VLLMPDVGVDELDAFVRTSLELLLPTNLSEHGNHSNNRYRHSRNRFILLDLHFFRS
jgi:hypothetical protein